LPGAENLKFLSLSFQHKTTNSVHMLQILLEQIGSVKIFHEKFLINITATDKDTFCYFE